MKEKDYPNVTLKDLIRTHARSYKFAIRGLFSIFLQQLNFRLELLISLIVIATGIILRINAIEWIVIVFAISLVLIAEALNSAIEAICDVVSRDFHKEIRHAKDIAAGSVLLAAIAAVIVGVIIFLPYIINGLK